MTERDEITPPEVYFNRRSFLRGGLVAGTAAATALLYRKLNGVELVETKTAELAGLSKPAAYTVNEPWTPKESITNYNNFYEFTTDKDEVAAKAAGFDTSALP